MFTPFPALGRRAALALVAMLSLVLPGLVRAQSTLVQVQTTQGTIEMQLYDVATPKTTANFLAYVRNGAWVDSFIHRSVAGFVVQLGGYAWPASGYAGHITTLPPVVNEFSSSRSNLRGTVAMAKVGGDPDSATSEWFFNLANNASNLDAQNGGFTVFARVTTAGMAVVDKIAALPRVNAGSAFSTLPYVGTLGTSLARENLVLVTAVTEFPPRAGQTDSDRIFNHLEKAYPEYIPAVGVITGEALGYVFRYYPQTDSYVGTKDGQVWYLVPSLGPDVQSLGTLTDWLASAVAAGF